jgi:ppGpp synthetase/RelA/SpoT-type nucleotidyltranferase
LTLALVAFENNGTQEGIMLRTEIELDALRALAGAEEVRKKVLAFVAMGNPSVDTLAYLIKCRIKNHDRLVEKVIDRQKKHPDYTAKDATDIVGLMILTLYRAELPIIIRHFMALIKFASEDPINLFVGPDLKHSLKEVIIYRASPDGDVVDQLVSTEFEKVGLSCAVVPQGTPIGEVEADVKIVRKATEYSSIHLVFGCYGFTKDKRYTVPLEVQIRTVVEDVWGEIDHSLNYKVEEGDPDSLDPLQKQHFENAKSGLKVLKRLLDGCTQQADLIHGQIQNIFGNNPQELKPSPAERSVDTRKLLDLDIDPNIQKKLSRSVEAILRCFEEIYADAWPKDPSDIVRAIGEFESAAQRLGECFSEYKRQPSQIEDVDRDANYYLRMERCLCLYWVAYLTKVILADQASENLKKEADISLELSLKEYFQIEKETRFSTDPILPFRIGNALRLRGYGEIAFDKFEEAFKKLSASKLAVDHHMKIRIPRAYSMMLWEQAEIVRRNAVKLNNPDLLLSTRHDLYLQALDVTIGSDASGTKVHATDDPGNLTADRIKTINNIVEYTLSYLRSGGSWDELEKRGITHAQLREYVGVLVGQGLESVRLPTVADTVRAAAHYFGDYDLVCRAAKRVLELISRPNFSAGISEESFTEMRQDAEADIRNFCR